MTVHICTYHTHTHNHIVLLYDEQTFIVVYNIVSRTKPNVVSTHGFIEMIRTHVYVYKWDTQSHGHWTMLYKHEHIVVYIISKYQFKIVTQKMGRMHTAMKSNDELLKIQVCVRLLKHQCRVSERGRENSALNWQRDRWRGRLGEEKNETM